MMLTISTSNLLAENAYIKKRADVVQGTILPLNNRLLFFEKQHEKCTTDVFLFQEVDENWEKVLLEFSEKYGYSLLIRPCRKLKMAIAFKINRFQWNNNFEYHHVEAGIFSVSLLDKLRNVQIKLVNIHADWDKAKNSEMHFNDIFQNHEQPVIIGGDFNLDKNKNELFFNELISKNNFTELTSELPFTAKYVKDASQGFKIDLLLTKHTSLNSSASIFPNDFSKLLPHTEDASFNPNDHNNHYSDHAVVTSCLSY